MSSADEVITALRRGHDDLAATVAGLAEADLTAPSAATEWDLSQVLSHLGSGAEINAATLRAALDGTERQGPDNRAIWDRWDAKSPGERAEGFLEADEALTRLYESIDAATRQTLRTDLGFLPEPVDLAAAGSLRLNELALHSWDVRAALDPTARLEASATAALLPGPTMLIGWISHPQALDGASGSVAVSTSGPTTELTLELGDQVRLVEHSSGSDGRLAIPAEAWLRLLTGRLGPRYTPTGIEADGLGDLELLRKVFPGF